MPATNSDHIQKYIKMGLNLRKATPYTFHSVLSSRPLFNKIGKVYSLEYADNSKAFSAPHHAGRYCTLVIRDHCCVRGHSCINVILSNCFLSRSYTNMIPGNCFATIVTLDSILVQ
jgi:hypothetical protein